MSEEEAPRGPSVENRSRLLVPRQAVESHRQAPWKLEGSPCSLGPGPAGGHVAIEGLRAFPLFTAAYQLCQATCLCCVVGKVRDGPAVPRTVRKPPSSASQNYSLCFSFQQLFMSLTALVQQNGGAFCVCPSDPWPMTKPICLCVRAGAGGGLGGPSAVEHAVARSAGPELWVCLLCRLVTWATSCDEGDST